MIIQRPAYLQQLNKALKRSPVTALLGPRQCGKTTLARMLQEREKADYFDLESQPDLRRLQNPELMLGSLQGLVILDEIQEMPELFKVLRVLVDRPKNRTRFLMLGSASPDIIRNVSESLAGRVEFVELSGFTLTETGSASLDDLWLRGGFPRSFLANGEDESWSWREGFIRTFLNRDIPQLGISIAAPAMHRFWTMLAHYHGQIWKAADLSRSLGLSDKTVRSYLDILTGTFLIRQLLPWHENIGKRQVKAPKIYFRDTGLLHSLLTIPDRHTLLGHPKVGASWEGLALEQVLQTVKPPQAFFWATHNGAELDLFFLLRGRRYGMEFKFVEAPKVTKSMHIALEDLHLNRLWIVYPGRQRYPVDEKISVWPLAEISGLAPEIR
jgi:uncharacterized protein